LPVRARVPIVAASSRGPACSSGRVGGPSADPRASPRPVRDLRRPTPRTPIGPARARGEAAGRSDRAGRVAVSGRPGDRAASPFL